MPFGSLWLPVVVATVAVFVVSSILHMALKYHNADYKKLPNEDAVGEVLRKAALAPALYVIPHCMDAKSMKDPEVVKKYEAGPVGIITILRNGPPAMGKYLVQWFALAFLISFTAAYVARHTLSAGASGLDVMRVTGTIAFAAYGYGHFQDSIWRGIPWSNTVRGLIDALVYAVVTGLAFWFLWPGA